MRIAQFAESYRPVINGAAVAVDLLAEELSRDHHVEIFAPRFPGFKDDRLIHRFPSYFVPGHGDYPLALPFSTEIGAWFQRGRFDVVHTHSPFALGQTGRRWARRRGLPVVTTYHTLYVEYAHYARVANGAVRAYLRSLSRRYCNACDAVAVPTEPIRKVLVEYGVKRPLRVIPTGLKLLPPLARHPETRRGLGIPADALLILYAGRLAREKNLELLFDAFARVARGMPDAWLLLAGSGPIEADVHRWAKQTGAGERIALPGFLPPERMRELYAAADLFAFSSLTDTQGLVLTEAKAAGLPAVSVDAYGPSTVVADGEDGFLVPNEADAFAEALARVLENPDLRARMREAALRNARRFSIEATAAAYVRLYEEARDAVRRT